MTLPTRRELDLQLAELQAENARLRDLLSAVREAASAVPVAVGDPAAELNRWRDIGIALRVHTRLRDVIDPAVQARCLRETAAEPPAYGVTAAGAAATRRLLDDLAAHNDGRGQS